MFFCKFDFDNCKCKIQKEPSSNKNYRYKVDYSPLTNSLFQSYHNITPSFQSNCREDLYECIKDVVKVCCTIVLILSCFPTEISGITIIGSSTHDLCIDVPKSCLYINTSILNTSREKLNTSYCKDQKEEQQYQHGVYK